MSNDFRIPDPKIAAMIASWPPFVELPKQAYVWFKKCRIILPPDQPIACDFAARAMLRQAAIETDRVGGTGTYWVFDDASAIVSNHTRDTVLDRWGRQG